MTLHAVILLFCVGILILITGAAVWAHLKIAAAPAKQQRSPEVQQLRQQLKILKVILTGSWLSLIVIVIYAIEDGWFFSS